MPLSTEQRVALTQRVEQEKDAACAMRHRLHAIPELAGNEHKTRQTLLDTLQQIGLTPLAPLIGTDVIAEINTGSPVKVCLRADMDALPISEQTGCDYASTHPGLMHACGHDAHTTMLLSAARILNEYRDQLPVSVRLVFQPGEEMVAMGRDLVAAGACDGCSEAYALHGRPGVPLGHITCRPGVMMATGGHIHATFHGRGCHGSSPDLGRNPIPAAADFVLKLEALRAELRASDNVIVTPCGIDAGLSGNVIPDTAIVSGTARYLSSQQHEGIRQRIQEAAALAAQSAGVTVELNYDTRYEFPVINSEPAFLRIRTAAIRALGEEKWVETEHPSMGMEDFAFFLRVCEGAMFWLGLGEQHAPLHRSDFNFSDEALTAGILMFCTLILDYDA